MSAGARAPATARPRRLRTGPVWLAVQIALAAALLFLLLLPIYGLFSYAPLSQIVAAAENSQVQAAVWLTLYASGIAVLATALLAVPLGYLLARRRFPGKPVVESLVALPIVVPHLMIGLGLFFVLAIPGTPLYDFTHTIGAPVYYTIWGVVLVMTVVSAPYTVVAAQLSFQAVDGRVIESARSLGAGSGTAFLTVTLPIAARGIVAGLLLTWARAVSEIGGLLILAYYVYPSGPYAGPITNPISIYIYDLFQLGDWTAAAAVSAFFLLIAFAIFIAVRVGEQVGWVPWRRGELAR